MREERSAFGVVELGQGAREPEENGSEESTDTEGEEVFFCAVTLGLTFPQVEQVRDRQRQSHVHEVGFQDGDFVPDVNQTRRNTLQCRHGSVLKGVRATLAQYFKLRDQNLQ